MKGFHGNSWSAVKSLDAITISYDAFKSSTELYSATASSDSKDELWKNVKKVFGDAHKCSASLKAMQENLQTLQNELAKPIPEGGQDALRSVSVVLKGLAAILAGGALLALLTGVGAMAGGALGAAAALAGATGELTGALAKGEVSPIALPFSQSSL